MNQGEEIGKLEPSDPIKFYGYRPVDRDEQARFVGAFIGAASFLKNSYDGPAYRTIRDSFLRIVEKAYATQEIVEVEEHPNKIIYGIRMVPRNERETLIRAWSLLEGSLRSHDKNHEAIVPLREAISALRITSQNVSKGES